MERRSWPWKKKSADKVSVALEPVADPLLSPAPQGEDSYKKREYVRISPEVYSRMMATEERSKGWETQMKAMEDEISDLNQKLNLSLSELSAKDDLVKQHVKVAEDAVSGWEKAEADASELKKKLESVTSSCISAESRASHLDDALKECMRQVRTLRDEHDHNLQQLSISKSDLWETTKQKLLGKIDSLDHDLFCSTAENATLSTSLKERSSLLLQLEKDKACAFAEIELLKSNIDSLQRELSSVKYEFRLASKEVEIRNEERDMSVRSAQALNRQHLDDVKKAALLEAECHRLRALVRKKLPGPGALVQMRLEAGVKKKNHTRNLSQHLPPLPDAVHKENRYLSDQLLAMAEEIKFLKAAMAENSPELKASTTKIRDFEEEQVTPDGDNPARVGSKATNVNNPFLSEGVMGKNEPSLTSVSEDGESCTESWASALISELSQIRKEMVAQKLGPPDGEGHIGLMDDFLEMEKLACLSENSCSPGPTEESPGSALVESRRSISNSVKVRSEIRRVFESLKGDHHMMINSNNEQDDLRRGGKGEEEEEEMSILVSGIRDFFVFLEKQAAVAGMGRWLESEDMKEFYVRTEEVLKKKLGLPGYVEALSPALNKGRELVRSFLLCWEKAKAENDGLREEVERERTKAAAEVEGAMGEMRAKMNVLEETEVRCMTESYKVLEARAAELEAEVSALQAEVEVLENEVREERQGREEAEARVTLFSQHSIIRREESGSGGQGEEEVKKVKKQWAEETTDLGAAAEKLAECQETILILGKQLQAMQPSNQRRGGGGGGGGDEEEAEGVAYYYSSALFSPCGTDGGVVGRSPMCTRQPRLRPSKSGSSSSSSTSTSEKPTARGFARFFTSKGKNNRR